MSNGDGEGLKVAGIIVAVAAAVIILYLLSKALLIIGIIGSLVGLVLLIGGFVSQDGRMALFGGIMLFVCIILGTIGYQGKSFFENTSTGTDILEGSQEIVEIATDTGEIIVDSVKDQQQLLSDIQESTTNAVTS